jgi:uncharacterized Zn finger protein
MGRKFTQLKDGDSMELVDKVQHAVVCCDCGLVHNYEVTHTKNARKTIVTVRRDNRATAQIRRYRHPELKGII